MAEKKLEEIIDLLAEYGGFNREYLRDKLLTFANDGRSKTKTKNKPEAENKMAEVAQLFGKELGEEFHIKVGKTVMKAKWTEMGLMSTDFAGRWWPCAYANALLMGEAVIVSAEGKPYSKD